MRRKHKKILLWAAAAVAAAVALEVALRLLLGLGEMPLYEPSQEWGLFHKPNQSGVRFGHHYYYNAYGMRCGEVDYFRPRLLGLGDSVLEGGIQIDQDSLATSIFSRETGVQMLNISASGWSARCAAAFLERHGLFDAQGAVYFATSSRAHGTRGLEESVGTPDLPDSQYPCAIAELACRYAYPRLISPILEWIRAPKPAETEPDSQPQRLDPGFDKLKQMCDSASIPLVVYLHATRHETDRNEYYNEGKEIIAWCQKNGVPLIKSLDYGFTPGDFRDGTHMTNSGMRRTASILAAQLPQLINSR